MRPRKDEATRPKTGGCSKDTQYQCLPGIVSVNKFRSFALLRRFQPAFHPREGIGPEAAV